MKKIYTIKIDDELPLTYEIKNNIKVICYLLYDSIKDIEEELNQKILYDGVCIDKKGKTTKVIPNELLDNYNGKEYNYKFISEVDKLDYRLYEPFIISDKSFGITVYDNMINDASIALLIDGAQKLAKTNYKYEINVYYYEEDEERLKTISTITHDNEEVYNYKNYKYKIKKLFSKRNN